MNGIDPLDWLTRRKGVAGAIRSTDPVPAAIAFWLRVAVVPVRLTALMYARPWRGYTGTSGVTSTTSTPSGNRPPTPSSTNDPISSALNVPAVPTSAALRTLVVAVRADGVAAASGTLANVPFGAVTVAAYVPPPTARLEFGFTVIPKPPAGITRTRKPPRPLRTPRRNQRFPAMRPPKFAQTVQESSCLDHPALSTVRRACRDRAPERSLESRPATFPGTTKGDVCSNDSDSTERLRS